MRGSTQRERVDDSRNLITIVVTMQIPTDYSHRARQALQRAVAAENWDLANAYAALADEIDRAAALEERIRWLEREITTLRAEATR